jgi:hypothetical protein
VLLIATLGAFLLAGTSSATVAAPPKPAQVVAALKSEDLPIGTYRVYTAANDPNKLLGRPGQYVGKLNFHDKRLPKSADYSTDSGGSVEVFKTRADAKRRLQYVAAITQSSPLFTEYQYLEGLILLRVAGDLTPGQARRYGAALKKRF